MRTCVSCGAEIGDSASFCAECGMPQGSTARSAAPKRTLAFAGLGLAGLALVAGVAAFLLFPRSAEGVLVSLTTGQPVAGATVRSVTGAATTDGSGRFTLRDLRLGRHPVTVTATGFPAFDAEVAVRPFSAEGNRLALPDAAVTIRLEETALQPKPVRGAAVLVGRQAGSSVATGTYELKGLRAGPATITVTCTSHEPTRTSIVLASGRNEVVVRLRLTPAETYSRYFEAYKAGQWRAAFAYLHPDVAKRESLASFTADMKDWGTPLSITMNRTKMLARWTSPKTTETYADVAEIDRTLVTQKAGGRYVSSLPQHWVNVRGLWLRVDY